MKKKSWQEIAKYQKTENRPGGVALAATQEIEATVVLHPGFGNLIIHTKSCSQVSNLTTSDNGGKKLRNCQVNLIFWGDAWNNSPTPSLGVVTNDAASIISGPYLTGLAQYGCNGAVLGGVYQTTAGENPPGNYTMDDVRNFIISVIDAGGLPDPDSEQTDTLHMVLMPPGSTPPTGLGGDHGYASYTDYDFPFDLDINDKSHVAFVAFASRAEMSALFSHELNEALSDPEGDGIQINPRNDTNWNEIGDACQKCRGTVNGVTVEPYWSQEDNACIIPVYFFSIIEITGLVKSASGHLERVTIEAVCGFDHTAKKEIFMYLDECIESIDKGNQLFISHPNKGKVNVNVHIRRRNEQSMTMDRFIAAIPGEGLADLLTDLPDCKIIPK